MGNRWWQGFIVGAFTAAFAMCVVLAVAGSSGWLD